MEIKNTMYGKIELGKVEVHYWSEYPRSGNNKTMYFKPLNVTELKPVKGLRRILNRGYYTCKTSSPHKALKEIEKVYNS